MKSESDCLLVDLWGTAIPVERLDVPIPFLLHVRRGNGLHPLHDVGLGEQVTAHPGRIQARAHMADLVPPHLKWANPAPHEGSQHVITVEVLLKQHLQDLVDGPELI